MHENRDSIENIIKSIEIICKEEHVSFDQITYILLFMLSLSPINQLLMYILVITRLL